MLDRNKPIAGNEKLFEGDGDGEKNPVGIIYTRRGGRGGEKWTPYFLGGRIKTHILGML